MQNTSKSSIISWWLEGLKLLFPTGLKNLFSPTKRQILMQLQADNLSIIWPSKKKHQTGAQLYQIDQVDDRNTLSNQLSKFSKDRYDIVLCMPTNKGLRKIISLPLNAEAELASIFEFEIERQTPFTREQVYSGYRITDKDKANNILNVELNVIPKKQVDPQLSKLQGVGIKPQVVELLTDQADPGINVLPGSHNRDENKATQNLNKFLALLSLLLLGFAIGLPFVNQEMAIEKTNAKIKHVKAEAQEITQLRSKWKEAQAKQKFINEKIEEHRPVTFILDELTHLIPDNTWLTRLSLKGKSVKIQGESSSPTSLLSIIETSNHFTGTRFQSPVTSNATTGKDRFQIITMIENISEEKSE